MATDPTSGQTVSFSAAGLPPGVSISPAGVITGWPAAGTYRVTVTAADSLQAQGAASFTGTVRVVADGTPRIRGKCLATGRSGTKNRTRVGLQPCTGGAAQRWMVQSGGELVNGKSGACLADPGSSSRNGGGAASGTALDIEPCTGTRNPRSGTSTLTTPGSG